MAGLDENGFTTKTFEDCREDINAVLDTEFGASHAGRLTVSVLGVLVAIVATLAAALWQLGLLIYNSQSPSGAFGALLDRVLELTGLTRLGATKSTVDCVVVGTNATVLPVGRRIKNAVTNTYWESTEEKTIATLSAWANSNAYTKGALRTNDSGKIYFCSVAGTSAGSGGPTGTGTAIVDGSCTWRYIAAGTAAVVVPFEAEEDGQIVGAAGDLTSIQTSQGGWSSVVNPLDADQGRSLETDAAVRIRRNAEIRSTGNAALDAILADVRAVDGVDRVFCFKNDGDATDADGVPAHSVEILVSGGDDADIFAAIFATVAAGIRTHGDEVDAVVDDQGEEQTVKFSRPTEIPIYHVVDIEIDEDLFPEDGDDLIKQAIVDFAAGLDVDGVTFNYGMLDIGDEVTWNEQFSPVYQIAGVVKVTDLNIGIAPAPSGVIDVPITKRQRAVVDTSRILVNHV